MRGNRNDQCNPSGKRLLREKNFYFFFLTLVQKRKFFFSPNTVFYGFSFTTSRTNLINVFINDITRGGLDVCRNLYIADLPVLWLWRQFFSAINESLNESFFFKYMYKSIIEVEWYCGDTNAEL